MILEVHFRVRAQGARARTRVGRDELLRPPSRGNITPAARASPPKHLVAHLALVSPCWFFSARNRHSASQHRLARQSHPLVLAARTRRGRLWRGTSQLSVLGLRSRKIVSNSLRNCHAKRRALGAQEVSGLASSWTIGSSVGHSDRTGFLPRILEVTKRCQCRIEPLQRLEL